MWTLTIEDEEGTRTRIPLARDAYFVGRERDNEVCLDERNISRKHAQLRKDGDEWEVEDLDSYNGTYINGTRVVGKAKLRNGDILQLGDYRLEFEDEADLDIDVDVVAEPEPVVEAAAQRPARLVVVVGPTPGQEFPLADERLTIGRAEEANLILQHASISRIHAEIIPIGNGHYEVVDAQSANGIRINGIELKRGILEAGDALELGDVRLRFVAKGKIFRPGSDRSQHLAAYSGPLGSEASAHASASIRPPPAKSAGKYIVIGLGLGAVCLAGVLALAFRAPAGTIAEGDPSSAASPTVNAAAAEAIAEAKELADKGDIEGAHAKIAAIPDLTASHDSPVVAEIEAKWAEGMFARANEAAQPADKRKILQQIATTPTVDPASRKRALDQITEIDAIVAKPAYVQNTGDSASIYDSPTAAAPRTTSTPKAPPAAGQPADSSAYAAQRRALEPKVWSGKATDQEIRLLRAICTHMGDTACRNRASGMLNKKK